MPHGASGRRTPLPTIPPPGGSRSHRSTLTVHPLGGSRPEWNIVKQPKNRLPHLMARLWTVYDFRII